MENNSQQSAAAAAGYPTQPPYDHLLQQQQQLYMFWTFQNRNMEENDFKNHQLPLIRIKKIMKTNQNVRKISAETPLLLSKACEIFIQELTLRSWFHAEENNRWTLQKDDVAAAIRRTDIFDFLVDVVHRDEIVEEVTATGMVGSIPSGVPYFNPPMAQPSPSEVMMGRPPVLVVYPPVYVQPQAWLPPSTPLQAWQPLPPQLQGWQPLPTPSQAWYQPPPPQLQGWQPPPIPAQAWQTPPPPPQAWQPVEDNSYASGRNSGQGSFDVQS